MLSEHHNAWDFGLQHASDELRQLSVTQDGCGAELLRVDLIENFAGGGQRFDEDGLFVGDGIRGFVQIFDRESEVFGEGAVVIDDTEDGAAKAVRFQSAKAELADGVVAVGGAGDVDFAGDAAADPAGSFVLDYRRRVSAIADRDDFAYEFVTGNAAEVVVAAEDLDVGVADAGEADLYEGPVGTEFGEGFFDGDQLAVGYLEGFHVVGILVSILAGLGLGPLWGRACVGSGGKTGHGETFPYGANCA